MQNSKTARVLGLGEPRSRRVTEVTTLEDIRVKMCGVHRVMGRKEVFSSRLRQTPLDAGGPILHCSMCGVGKRQINVRSGEDQQSAQHSGGDPVLSKKETTEPRAC